MRYEITLTHEEVKDISAMTFNDPNECPLAIKIKELFIDRIEVSDIKVLFCRIYFYKGKGPTDKALLSDVFDMHTFLSLRNGDIKTFTTSFDY